MVGWMAVAAYAALLAWSSISALGSNASAPSSGANGEAAEQFIAAWERSREATFVTIGTYERRSGVSGATLTSEDIVVQRPPQRLHRQLGGVDGVDDDRLVLCPAPPEGDEERAAPCQAGGPSGVSYAERVRTEVEGLRSILGGEEPLYSVTSPSPGCFELVQRRIDPRAPFGVRSSFCFDGASGAVRLSRVRHEGGIAETVVVTAIRTEVSDADLVL